MVNPTLLQRGDIIRLEKGMKVYASVPEKFVFVNTPFSDKPYEGVITLGYTLHKKVPNRDEFTKELKEDIEKRIHREITTEQVSNFVDSLSLNFYAEEFDVHG